MKKLFPRTNKIGNNEAIFLTGVWEYESDYLGWGIYYLHWKAEFAVWTVNTSGKETGFSGGSYVSNFSDALKILKEKISDPTYKYGERDMDKSHIYSIEEVDLF